MKNSTIKDVARRANVSIATVSRAVNNSPLVSEETRQRVMKVIEELGYQPNALARGLVSRKSNTIGVLITDVTNLFSAEVFRGMEDAAHERNSNVFICNTDADRDRMLRYITFLHEKQVEGVIFTSEEIDQQYYEALQKLQVPVVLVATESETYKLPAVKINDFEAARSATTYLIKKGHRRIAMLSGDLSDRIAGRPRYEGYCTALREHGIDPVDSWVSYGDYRFQSGQLGMKTILEHHPEITAVFAASDEMAVGAILQATRMGRKIPDDLSMIGFDNVRLAEMSNPPLTTVSQSLYEMGQAGVDLLFQLIEESHKKGKVISTGSTRYIPHQIIERESVRDISC